MCATTLRMCNAYGREVCIRSWALRILDADTICSALVTLRVFATLLILVRISLAPAMCARFARGNREWRIGNRQSDARFGCQRFPTPDSRFPASPTSRLLELVQRRLEGAFDVGVPVTGLDDLLHQVAVVGLHELVQRVLERQDLRDRQIIQVTLVGRVQRNRQLRDRQRRVLLL